MHHSFTEEEKKSQWLTMAPRSSVQLIDKRQDVMSHQIVWECCKRAHWGVNQRLKNALRES